MPQTALTDEQLLARDTRDVSVALAAGAGCGKTLVLTERYLSDVDPAANNGQPAQLHQLIAITFTDAAAREMRTRIRNNCYERQRDANLSEKQQSDWLRLLREIETARVSTIHAFCTTLLRAHAAEAGVDPTFGVLEQSDADVLQYEVIDEVLRVRLLELDPDVLDLAATFGLAQLKQQLAILLGQRHQPHFDQWLVAKDDQPAKLEELIAIWKQCYERDAFLLAVQKIAEKAPIAEMVRLLGIAGKFARNKFAAAIATLLELLPRLEQLNVTRAEVEQISAAARVQGLCSKNDWPTEDQFEAYKAACKKLRDAVSDGRPLPWHDDVAREAATLGLMLLRLAHEVAAAYRDRKNAQGKLDFDDQLLLAHRLITNPNNAELRRRLSEDLRLLLVDEFQDTDPLQVELIRAICGDGFESGRLFFVGDIKQSIYRFRGATPPEFLKLRDQVQEAGRLKLTKNFRSLPGILHFVNGLFHDAFPEYEPLHPVRKAAGQAPAVEFLWTITPQKKAKEKKRSVEAARREEAKAIACRLRELIFEESCSDTPVVDKDTNLPRRVRPGDVAILFRALSDVRLYEEELRAQGLEYYLVGGHAFYAQQEVYDVLNLLRAVVSTADEVSLAGVLRSPFFSLLDETLFWLVEQHGSLNAGLLADPPPELSAEERAKVAAAADTIRHLRAIKDLVPIATVLNTALARTGYDAALVAEFLGERKLANLQKLLEQARAADHGGVLDLDGFITQLTEFIAQPPKEPLASTSPESADVIRLMTIHRAKGLEFPLVVLPDLDRPPLILVPPAALDAELGPLVRLPDDDEREEAATGMSLYAARERAEELEERKRLLYVGCTRAADYLLLSSSLVDHDKHSSDWMKLVADHFDLRSGQFIGTLPPGYELPRVHVPPMPATDQVLVGKSRGPDLIRLLDEARQAAADGRAKLPTEVEPIAVDRTARQQFSFSRLTGQLVRSDPFGWLSRSMGDEPDATRIDPRGLGTLVHEVLQCLSLPAKKSSIQQRCEQLAPEHVPLDAERAAEEARTLIERFAESPRAKQLAQAAVLHREIEFLLAWPPERHIRGVIDCLYQDANGGWHILDYKTNDVPAAGVERAAEQYKLQMYVYALAAERAIGCPPVELALHFLRPGRERGIGWNEEARIRAVEQITAAIANAVEVAPLTPDP